ncbi:hypothetical protein DFP78_11684 [Photobacterium lutimaris]|nr:hypothetical protein DFP78_11684 [Photobacterium lutimaris]
MMEYLAPLIYSTGCVVFYIGYLLAASKRNK